MRCFPASRGWCSQSCPTAASSTASTAATRCSSTPTAAAACCPRCVHVWRARAARRAGCCATARCRPPSQRLEHSSSLPSQASPSPSHLGTRRPSHAGVLPGGAAAAAAHASHLERGVAKGGGGGGAGGSQPPVHATLSRCHAALCAAPSALGRRHPTLPPATARRRCWAGQISSCRECWRRRGGCPTSWRAAHAACRCPATRCRLLVSSRVGQHSVLGGWRCSSRGSLVHCPAFLPCYGPINWRSPAFETHPPPPVTRPTVPLIGAGLPCEAHPLLPRDSVDAKQTALDLPAPCAQSARWL